MNRSEGEGAETLTSAVSKYTGTYSVRAHFPGHKGRASTRGRPDTLWERGHVELDEALDLVQRFDVTEAEGLDNLLYPKACIKETEEWIARVFGARRSVISTGGATAGVLAAFLAAKMLHPERSKAALTRGAHRSAISGIILAGLEPVFFYPEFVPFLGGYLPASAEDVMPVLEEYGPELACLFLVNPTYYGLCADISQVISAAHQEGVPVIVDEAHGSHFPFSRKLPPSALTAGADIVIHGVHKSLPVLTQGGLLHVGLESLVPVELVEEAFRLVATSSPSYILMSSIERGVRIAAETDWVDSGIRTATKLSSILGRIPDICVNQDLFLRGELPGQGRCGQARMGSRVEAVFRWDPGRISISACNWRVRGRDMARALMNAGLSPEMAGERDVLLVVTGADDESAICRMVESVREMMSRGLQCCDIRSAGVAPRIAQRMPPREAFFSTRKYVNIDSSAGMVVAETVMIYPPGVPILVPGEEVSVEAIEYIRRCESEGLAVLGVYQRESEMMLACVDSW
ncbi:MAG: hypothetical protein IMW97_07565 [Firmicutes bacterium]|nr:hypothetical protein [Candidatus Fermentithermobacillaceae bacterium]